VLSGTGSLRLGFAAIAVMACVVLAAVAPVLFRIIGVDAASGPAMRWGYIAEVAGFTVWQAALSTILSVGLGGLTGLALARASDFPGRRWLLLLFAVPLAVPALVAVIGVVAIYGENGLLTRAAATLGLERPGTIYGLQGILITHVLFNLPLVARFVVAALDSIPEESSRLADMLALPAGARFRHIEWPVLMRVLPGASSLVFLLCLTSFAVALTLGGGPQATTLEVALYQALRFDLDFALAAKLALIELAIAALALLALDRELEVEKLRIVIVHGCAPEVLAGRHPRPLGESGLSEPLIPIADTGPCAVPGRPVGHRIENLAEIGIPDAVTEHPAMGLRHDLVHKLAGHADSQAKEATPPS